MRGLSKGIVILGMLFLSGCTSVSDSKNGWFRDVNVCKKLVGKVLVYPVFVQARKGEKWKEIERKEYMDSMKVALSWIESQAFTHGVDVTFLAVDHPKVIKKGFPGKTVKGALDLTHSTAGFVKFNKHYDNVSKLAASGVPEEEKLKPFVKKIKSKERLIAKLRNAYQVESVVLIFVHKPELLDNVFLTMNSLTNKDVEYAVTTFRAPTVMAYQVLELFGAAPIMYSESNKKELCSYKYVKNNFPTDIMANLGKSLQSLDIGAYTSYLVGWNSIFKEEYNTLYPKRKVIH